MNLINLLNSVDVEIGLFGQTFDVYLNWIGKIIQFLISGVGVVGIGIILFSLILKLVVLPFDVYQRISMRKQNIKMKENQERMEKLQKQYANDKEKYNQKVMEMYKESGVSMFSSCLPMILSMIIFIVAINAFNAYSQYSNIENYNTMVEAYNTKMEYYCADLTEENIRIEGDKIVVKDEKGENSYIYYTLLVSEDTPTEKKDIVAYVNANKTQCVYMVDVEKAYKNKEIAEYTKAKVAAAVEENDKTENAAPLTEQQKADVAKSAIKSYFEEKAQEAVVETYNTTVKEHTSFLWIKNIWATDASYKHPVLNYSEFKTEIEREDFRIGNNKVSLNAVGKYTNVYTADAYNKITAKLTEAKSEANGYYVLILLSIGTILLQQFISMRSQKEQQKFSTVDGQGASQQKMMMIIMTGMFAIFSFMYSSAFSIYMITSNLFSMLSTVVINKLVDRSEYKKEKEEIVKRHDQRLRMNRSMENAKENATRKNKENKGKK
ncbi:MAG: YidC/Oxa1 family membrane protein insertase [Clostridia bacterium]|nr:YidC/Oxa1 family membrane protein insertase [Clostridia bacterium]